MRWAALAGFACSLVAAGGANAACTITKLAELPVTMVGDRPIVPAKVNGVDVQFMADSGAFYSLISPGSARELRLPLSGMPFGYTMSGVGGDVIPSIATVRKFTLLTSVIPDVSFLVGGSEIDPSAIGVLGQNVLGLADVEYDLADGAIRLFRPQGCGRLAMAYWHQDRPWSVVEIDGMDDRNRHTVGTAKVNGKTIRVMFDTGSSRSVMSLQAAARAGIRPDAAGVTFAGLSSGIGRRLVKSWIAPVDSFQIGDEQIKHTKLRIGDVGLPDTDMLLGADFFLSHRVYVANSQRKLYFTYNGGPVFDLRVSDDPPPGMQSAAGSPPDVKPAPGDPVDADGFSRRGAALAGRGEYVPAIADFSRAMALAPDDPRYVFQRATARLNAHQPFLAMADLDTVLKLKPDDAMGRLLRARLRLEGHDRDGARQDMDAADRALSKEADLRLILGELYLTTDAFDPAVAEFDQWIAVHEDDRRMAQALNGRCWARALADKDLDKALSDCNRAVRQAEVRAAPLDSRGLVHLRRGELDRAISDYDAALGQNPKLAWSLYGRGLAELESGDKAKGQADLTAAAALAPHLAERAAKLGLAPAS